MDDGDQYFKIYIYPKIFMCQINRWVTINDVNMTSWV